MNLINFNPFITYHHFKMDTIDAVINIMRLNCFMGSIDLANAYFSVPILRTDRTFLRFMWNYRLYQFTVLPNGLSSAPRIFTKMLKPVYAHLRQLGHIACGYIDDSFVTADSLDGCVHSIECTANLFTSLGFTINVEKSITTPTQELEHLGFLLNSKSMTVVLTDKKKRTLIQKCNQMLANPTPTIRTLAELIGLIVFSFNAVEFGPLHYRYLEWDKVQALKISGGDFDKSLCLSDEALGDILWWTNNVSTEIRRIDHINYNLSLTTDASEEGWGAVFDTLPHSGVKQATGGRWVHHEKHSHINVLELKASFFGLKSFASDLTNVHIKVSMDNTTAIAYVNHMGGSHSMESNEVAMSIWAFCRQRDIWLTAVHLPGHLNVLADQKSRIFDDKTEWHLNPGVFRKIVLKFVMPEIDLFASRLNYQLKPYVAWMPDPEAQYIDAFTLDIIYFVCFPTFLHVNSSSQEN